jgi:hypothetical protein
MNVHVYIYIYATALPIHMYIYLIELGIHFDHIWMKTRSVLLPTKKISEHILDDTDLAGPLVFAFVLGMCLLLVRRSLLYFYKYNITCAKKKKP